jgi:hypothetical protein
MMRPPLGTVEKYTFKSTGMGMTTGGRTGSADPSLNLASAGSGGMASHHGGGGAISPINLPKASGTGNSAMGGGNMASHHGGRRDTVDMQTETAEASVQITKRQMMNMGGGAWYVWQRRKRRGFVFKYEMSTFSLNHQDDISIYRTRLTSLILLKHWTKSLTYDLI